MKEHPIIMTGWSVRAILDGRKTQTRRVIQGLGNLPHYDKLLDEWALSEPPYQYVEGMRDELTNFRKPWNWQGKEDPQPGDWCWPLQIEVDDNATFPMRCPYGVPGDRLWVREPWTTSLGHFAHTIIYQAGNKSAGLKFSDDQQVWIERYERKHGNQGYSSYLHEVRGWAPSIFMPRWASRITLEVVNIRVERVQEISFDDAIAEGVCEYPPDAHGMRSECRRWFEELWDEINAKRGYGWDVNPWVWVIEFKQVTP